MLAAWLTIALTSFTLKFLWEKYSDDLEWFENKNYIFMTILGKCTEVGISTDVVKPELI